MNVTTTKVVAGVAALAVIAGVGSVSAHGFRGADKDPEAFAQKRQAVVEALENNDYAAWVEAVGDHPRADVVTEENFGTLVEIHELRESGDIDAARALAEENGLDKKFKRHGKHRGMKRAIHRIMHNEAAQDALANGDYQAFIDAFGEDSKIAEKLTQERFDAMVEKYHAHHSDQEDN